MATHKPWQSVAIRAQKHRDETIAQAFPDLQSYSHILNTQSSSVEHVPQSLLTSDEVFITETSPDRLLKSLASGALKSVDVTRAFLKRAAIAQQLVNCITELLPERALDRAQELDEHFERTGKLVGPLHGLPISVKEHVAMEGLGICGAYVSLWDQRGGEDALVLEVLKRAGCVFHARTTEPQTLMHLETSSNLYGTTVNPFNRSLTAGGSSGGEGALVALRGSCLGIGSDVGGSIRSPAANNGLYGFRPSTHRIPLNGVFLEMEGMEQILGVLGPLSTSLDGINLFMKTVIDAKPWTMEPALVPLPWSIDEPKFLRKKLKVGVMRNDGVVRPHPPVLRAIDETVAKLRESNDVEVVEWTPYKHDLAWEIIASLYFVDGGDAENNEIAASGEPWLPLSKFIVINNPHAKRRSVEEIWKLTQRRDDYRTEHARYWNGTATGADEMGAPEGMVDVILCPVGPGAAPPLECSRYWAYTSQWNLLDYPALVFPVGKVDAARDVRDKHYQPGNGEDEYNHSLYTGPEQYKNAPVSLQLVGRRYEDEKVIQAFQLMQRYIDVEAAGGDPR